MSDASHPNSGPIDLHGRVAIVTGGARGIGRAICLALAREGADVVIVDRSDAGATVAAIAAQGRRAHAQPVDVTSTDDVRNMVEWVIGELGQVDILVNNAGIVERSPLEEIDDATWERTIGVNLRGTFNCTRAVYPHMRQRGYGKIVNVASVSGKNGGSMTLGAFTGDPSNRRSGPAYTASKGGIIAFTRWLAREAGVHGIWSNCVCPGAVISEMTRGHAYPVESQPIGRMGTPEDVAEAVVFLASPASNFITGASINVDGGLVMD